MRDGLTLYLIIQVPEAINLADLNISNMMAAIVLRKPTKKGNNIWRGRWGWDDDDRRIYYTKYIGLVYHRTNILRFPLRIRFRMFID